MAQLTRQKLPEKTSIVAGQTSTKPHNTPTFTAQFSPAIDWLPHTIGCALISWVRTPETGRSVDDPITMHTAELNQWVQWMATRHVGSVRQVDIGQYELQRANEFCWDKKK